MEDPTNPRLPTVFENLTSATVAACCDELVSDPPVTREGRRPHDASVEFRYLDQNDAWVPLALPPADGRYLSAAHLVHMAVSEAAARGIRSIVTALELTHPMTHNVLGALQRHLGTHLKTVDTRRAGSSVMVTARLLAPQLAHAAPDVVTQRGPDTHGRRPTTALPR